MSASKGERLGRNRPGAVIRVGLGPKELIWNGHPPGVDVAAAPLGLHLLDAPGGDLNAEYWLPLFQQGRDQRLKLLSVPAQQNGFRLFYAASGPYEQVQACDTA